MTQRKFGKSWWVDFTHNGIRYRKKSPQNSKEGAKAYEAHLRQSLAEGKQVVDGELKLKQSQLFKSFVPFWFKTYVMVHNKPSEISRKRSVVKTKLIPFFGNLSLNSISTLDIERFKALYTEARYSPRSINSYLDVLGKCLRDAAEWYEMGKIPKIKLLKAPPDKHDFFSQEECLQLLENISSNWYDVVLTALKTGMRVGELRALNFEDIQWETRSLSVNHTWCDVSRKLVSPKSNKGRVIPLTDDVYNMLLTRRSNGNQIVFPSKRGVRFTHAVLNRHIRKACEKTNLKPVGCHYLRHTFASHLALAGVPLIVIQKLLGHSNIQITMRYAHLAKTSLRDAVTVLENRFSQNRSSDSNEKGRDLKMQGTFPNGIQEHGSENHAYPIEHEYRH